jgi:hypothetical protein
MPTLINLHGFAVSVAALGRDLAPYEAVVVEDENVVRQACSTGILHSDLEDLTEDGEKALANLKELGSELANTWRAEHGAAIPVEDQDRRELPFISTAQQNHVEGLVKGNAKVAELQQGQATVEGIDASAELDAPGQLPAAKADGAKPKPPLASNPRKLPEVDPDLGAVS